MPVSRCFAGRQTGEHNDCLETKIPPPLDGEGIVEVNGAFQTLAHGRKRRHKRDASRNIQVKPKYNIVSRELKLPKITAPTHGGTRLGHRRPN